MLRVPLSYRFIARGITFAMVYSTGTQCVTKENVGKTVEGGCTRTPCCYKTHSDSLRRRTPNTAHLLFEDCKIPAKNLIGKENQGFLPIMLNFNHERMVGIVGACRASRSAIEESIKYARERKTFGKRLIDHQVLGKIWVVFFFWVVFFLGGFIWVLFFFGSRVGENFRRIFLLFFFLLRLSDTKSLTWPCALKPFGLPSKISLTKWHKILRQI